MTKLQYLTNSPAIRTTRARAMLDTFFAGIGQGFNAYIAARSRIGEIERLDAMTETELAEMGLRREDIPRHVFRDVLHL